MTELNQNCPCKSGLKYRDCCLPLEGLPEFLKEQGICNENKIFSEHYTLKTLLKKSPEFAAFYKSEREKIKFPIVWTVDPTLVPTMSVGFISNLHLIIIRKSPIEITDAFDAAHELRHIICSEEGFPAVSLKKHASQDQYNNYFSQVFPICLNDPLANKGLIKYNFNLWNYYERACNAQEQNLRNGTLFPNISDFRFKAFFVSLYIQKVLDWELANTVETRSKPPFITRLEMLNPSLSNESSQLISQIKTIGFDTPDKATVSLNKIIKVCGVSHILETSNTYLLKP